MLRAEDEQRSRIAADLHDDTVQVMTAAVLSLDRVTGAIQRGDMQVALEAARAYRTALEQAMDRTRRLMFELRPPALVTSGLRAALGDLLEEASGEAGFTSHLECAPGRFGDMLESLVYRAMAEGVVNVRKHADAANVWLECHVQGDRLVVCLRDDGRGFDEADLADAARRRLHLGLDSIAERVRLAGGRFAIQSAPGRGTRMTLSLRLGNGAGGRAGQVP
jgi:signal transduction histidine kinase